ncbi:hypothetical protein BKA61DRAFT_729934 [Leptodontidium sp. MPI-SDFR-AT-0119]|nr:hypothetical protein BKA61DRAFT_729934 [Leptodontidium sp. MPI-SDFR-AT-0119]
MSSTNPPATEMEPIPLRTLTVLLAYEKMATDPRFVDHGLVVSSTADPGVLAAGEMQNPSFFSSCPRTIIRRSLHQFEQVNDAPSSIESTAMCKVSPNAGPEVKNLTVAQLDSIYYESLGHNGCYSSISLYQYFFQLCPPDQRISIQIKNEEPVIVDPSTRQTIEFGIMGPKPWTVVLKDSSPSTLLNGGKDGDAHAILGFPYPGSKFVNAVVDLSRMQYGEVGRGSFGEFYFVGSYEDYCDSTEKNICTQLQNRGTANYMNPSSDLVEEARLKGCTERVWERWQNRHKQGWCAHCGKGGKLLKCSGCRQSQTWYCCKEHQVAGWKLHKHTCEKGKH